MSLTLIWSTSVTYMSKYKTANYQPYFTKPEVICNYSAPCESASLKFRGIFLQECVCFLHFLFRLWVKNYCCCSGYYYILGTKSESLSSWAWQKRKKNETKTGLSFVLAPVRLSPNHDSGHPPSPSTSLITTMFGCRALEVRWARRLGLQIQHGKAS